MEARVKSGNIIDFARSVSPILYRLFRHLVKREILNLENYIHGAKNNQYDVWLFTEVRQSDYTIFHRYLEIHRDNRVTSKTLAELLRYGRLPQGIKQLVNELCNFEKFVRSPLAHLTEPFDEGKLHRTTGFSSQAFLDKIIVLATYADVKYNKEKFYLDQVNDIIRNGLKKSG